MLCIGKSCCHQGRAHVRVLDDKPRHERVVAQVLLERLHAPRRLVADRVVGEAHDRAAGGMKIVLAEPVIGELDAIGVIGEPVELDRKPQPGNLDEDLKSLSRR